MEEGFRSADFQSLASYKDAMVQKMFNLSPDSVVMKEFEIKFKKKTGTLYLFPQHLGFTASKSEGTTFVISLSTIIDIEKNVKKNAVICYTENKKVNLFLFCIFPI